MVVVAGADAAGFGGTGMVEKFHNFENKTNIMITEGSQG